MNSTSQQPGYVAVGGIIIDDIVYPDGKTCMGVLGGGVTHAAVGLAIWDQRPGVMAYMGHDLPAAARHRLERDFDTQGLIHRDIPQARAWQLFEWDGRRTEIFRAEAPHSFSQHPMPDELPSAYRAAKGLFVLADAARVCTWRAHCAHMVLLWEPEQQYMIPENAAEFRAALPQVDIVSPNWLEAQLVYTMDDPAALVRALLQDGAKVAVLRMGEAGSLAGMQYQRDLIRLLPVPVPAVVDQTGAGNTFCGGFLAGWLETGDLCAAACYGAVAASFALETVGVADPPSNMAEIRDQRYRWALDHLLIDE